MIWTCANSLKKQKSGKSKFFLLLSNVHYSITHHLPTCESLLGFTHNAFVKVPLHGNKNIAKGGAQVGCGVHVLCCPHVMTHLHQHVERVEAVHLVSQSNEVIQLNLYALKDLVHHMSHHFLTVKKG